MFLTVQKVSGTSVFTFYGVVNMKNFGTRIAALEDKVEQLFRQNQCLVEQVAKLLSVAKLNKANNNTREIIERMIDND